MAAAHEDMPFPGPCAMLILQIFGCQAKQQQIKMELSTLNLTYEIKMINEENKHTLMFLSNMSATDPIGIYSVTIM